MRLFRPLYEKTLEWAARPRADAGLALLSFVEAFIFPVAPEIMLAPMTLARPRKWWQFALYCPALEKVGLHLWTKRVERDDNYINAMELDLIEFEKLVTENETKLRNYHSKPADITPPWEREAA